MVRNIVQSAVRQVYQGPLEDETQLLGGALDSMALLEVIVSIEEKLAEQGGTIRIMSEHAMSLKRSPFKTMGSLIEYVEALCQLPS